ncbi:uroporphyrinogen-III C-methyltransferase [Methylotenera sp.]|uniref:uroporphyrinogen-III C-methyltransferase n=1 Tax=Methylotenera sp. TaxID=2051956 RepID=UPI0026011BFD|nr:uroporphyrinogen-III C-methyltransferase [Methylotenera sp.]
MQLAGNVKSALLALEAADHRLEPLDLPRAVQLRQTLQVEIETLRDLPQIDMIAMSAQLTYLAELCNSIPLISERQPRVNQNASQHLAPVQSLHGVEKFWWAIWDDIKNLVTVERIDQPEPPLLAAEHALYLRENLKLRLLTARIALLQHDESTYKADLSMVKTWLNQYFDTKHPDTIKALVLLKKLSSNNISLELPQLSDSLAAVSSYKLMLEKSE